MSGTVRRRWGRLRQVVHDPFLLGVRVILVLRHEEDVGWARTRMWRLVEWASLEAKSNALLEILPQQLHVLRAVLWRLQTHSLGTVTTERVQSP